MLIFMENYECWGKVWGQSPITLKRYPTGGLSPYTLKRWGTVPKKVCEEAYL